MPLRRAGGLQAEHGWGREGQSGAPFGRAESHVLSFQAERLSGQLDIQLGLRERSGWVGLVRILHPEGGFSMGRDDLTEGEGSWRKDRSPEQSNWHGPWRRGSSSRRLRRSNQGDRRKAKRAVLEVTEAYPGSRPL